MAVVNVTVKNDDAGGTKQQNVTVFVYNTLAIFQTSNVTNALGVATFNLPDASYDLLFFKEGFSVLQPQRIVVDSLLVNDFEITGHLRALPESLDNIMCRVSGFIYGTDGVPVRDIDVRFDQVPINIVANQRQIFNSPVQSSSSEKGYFEFDLLRNVKYEAGIEGYPYPLFLKTPNVAAIELVDLLFPIHVSLVLSSNIVSVAKDAINSTIAYTATFSDTNTGRLYNDWSVVHVDYSVDGIAVLSANETHLLVQGITPGVTVATFSRVFDSGYQWINPKAFTAPTLTITVT